MQKYNLLSVIRRKKYCNYGNHLHKYNNLIFMQIDQIKSGLLIYPYIHTKQGVQYLSIIRDLNNNSIVAYKTGAEQNLSTIRAARHKEQN